MKIQCQCGAKYAFDVTPEMAHDPVRFACPGCGVDLSGPINDLIRQELSGAAAVPPPAPAPQPVVAPATAPAAAAIAPPPPPVPATSAPRLSISRSTAHAAAAPAAEAPAANAPQTCPKHRGEPIVEKCFVCQKPLCLKCMEMFGYVCSPLCKAKADSHGIDVPIYAGQKSVREAKQWRKVGLIGAGIAALVIGLIGLWIWWAWFGSLPHPIFSVRFEDQSSYAGSSQRPDANQLVFVHGGVLARYDIKTKKQIWQRELVTKADVEAEFQRRKKEIQEAANASRGSDFPMHIPLDEDIRKDAQIDLEQSQRLIVSGQNVWVEQIDSSDRKMVRYDWASGNPAQTISLTNHWGEGNLDGKELVFLERNDFEQNVITHISLESGESRVDVIGERIMTNVGKGGSPKVRRTQTVALAGGAGGTKGKQTTGGGLPLQPGPDSGKPMDPKKVEEDFQNLPLAAKLALPATLSNVRHQQQLFRAMKEDGTPAIGQDISKYKYVDFEFLPSKYGNLQWNVRMLQENFVVHDAMKPQTGGKSAMDKALDSGNVTVGRSLEMSTEIVNQWQREEGGGETVEDLSKYQITLHQPDAKDVADWTGEVIGMPFILPQKTVNIVMGGKSIIVLDKSNKKLWQADLGHAFGGGSGFEQQDEAEQSLGAGPCVERGDTLYIFDEATLTAFDLSNGNVRWRVPSVGILGLFFDDQGAIYMNTTSSDLDSLRFSRQIELGRKASEAVLKIDAKTGKVLWTVDPGGFISHVEGKYILCFASHQAPDDVDPDSLTSVPGAVKPSVMAIRRLDPKTGKVMWDYAQKRAPLDVRFHGNTIDLVFRKEVQVLKFLSF